MHHLKNDLTVDQMETQTRPFPTNPIGASYVSPSSFHPLPLSTLTGLNLYHLRVHSFKECLLSTRLVS